MPGGSGGFLRASEAIAVTFLESIGFRVREVHKKVVLGGIEVSDVDVVAERGGELYAVEVKSGAVDVDAVRQAFVNARVLGMKPAIVGRGFADERARALAGELGVEVYLLSDLLVVSAQELREAVYEAVFSALNTVLESLTACPDVAPEEERVLEALASSATISQVAEKLGVSERDAAGMIASLSEKGVLPRGSLKLLSLVAKALILCRRVREASGRSPAQERGSR